MKHLYEVVLQSWYFSWPSDLWPWITFIGQIKVKYLSRGCVALKRSNQAHFVFIGLCIIHTALLDSGAVRPRGLLFHMLCLNLTISYQIASLFDMYIDMGDRIAGKHDIPSLIIEDPFRGHFNMKLHIYFSALGPSLYHGCISGVSRLNLVDGWPWPIFWGHGVDFNMKPILCHGCIWRVS